jgi:branched-chain amino acid aminotransferase
MLFLIDGKPSEGGLSVFDGAVLRGDGCFEAIRSYRGRPFAVSEHYARLTRSASALRIPVPDRDHLGEWVSTCAAAGGDCMVRVVLSRGGSVPGAAAPSRCLVLWHPLPPREALDLLPVAAPWHPGGEEWELSGVKTISYAANEAASRRAREGGAADALLYSRAGHLLEGPTFSVAWVVDGVLETPSLDLGILESITRGMVLDYCAGESIPVREGRFPLSRLEQATEVLAMSTVKEVTTVQGVGERRFAPGPVTALLAAGYRKRVEAESSGDRLAG